MEFTDEQLIEQFRETGEMQWFDSLVHRHVGRVRAMVYPMVLNDADASEVTQDVFIRVIKGLPRFRCASKFTSWLHRITMNTTYTFLKRRGQNPVETRDVPPEKHDHSGDPSEHLAATELDAQIKQALSELSPRLRAAITLTSIQGMSVEDAAKAEGCLKATMYWRIHEARRILKDTLKV